MYIDTYALGEAKAESASDFLACGCTICMGKSQIARDYTLILPDVARGTVTAAAAAAQPITSFGAPRTVFAPPSSPDDSVTGALTAGESGDLYEVNLVAGQTYSFALRGTVTDGIDDPVLALLDDAFEIINVDDDGGAGVTSLITFTATTTGVYYVLATSFAAGFNGNFNSDLGNYTLDLWQQRATDQVPDTFTGAVEIDAGTTYGHIETSNDVDTYKVFLEAGKIYTFELTGGADYQTDFLDVPAGELDTLLALYAPNGTFIGGNDDISFPNDISSGFTFQPTVSGVYFLDVFAYAGQTGGYTLDVAEIDPSLEDPLDSINWFTSNNIPTVLVNGVETAYVYFGDSDENFGQTNDAGTGPMVTIDWNAFERQQVMLALEEYTRILGINYVVTDNSSQATFRLLKTESQQYGAYFFPQDPSFGASQGVGVFNVLSGGWSLPGQPSLQEGGYSFAVILHEFGHAHGLAHPHDNGGSSDIMLGVTAPTGSYGLFNLNLGVYTVMSYNDAWDFHPDGPTPFTIANIDSGWSGTLGAFDIAVLQQRYGAVARETGNTVYRLGDANDPGTFYQTIWDTAGIDEIRYDGARAAQIDLTAATLDYSPTGGGVVSFVDEIWGGYTIAGGVVIENATGGSGNDVLLGNAAANTLKGNNGADTLQGRGGDDILFGGAGIDDLDGGEGSDTADYFDGPQGAVTVNLATGVVSGASGADTLTSIENIRGSRASDTLTGDAGANRINGESGNDTINGGGGADLLFGDAGTDTINGGTGFDVLTGGLGVDRFIFTSLDGDRVADWTAGEKINVSAFAGSGINIVTSGGTATVSFDRDNDGQFDDGFFTVTVGAQAFGINDLIVM